MKREARITTFPQVWRALALLRHRWFAIGLLLSLILPANVSRAFAAEPAPPSLSGTIDLRFQRCRSGAPIPVVWEIEWNEQTIAQGNLDYEIEDGNELLARFRMSDVILSPGKNVFNSMLPAMTVFGRSAPVTLHVRFVSGKRTYELEEQSLRVPNRFTQWFNVAVVSGATGKPSQADLRILDAIRWERLLTTTDPSDRSTTVSLDVQAAQLPAEPLTFCNFDAVVLMPAALSEIRGDQADALKKWVTAGGSVCVIAGGGLTARHSGLINELLSESTGREAFLVNSHGYLAPGEEFTGEIVSARKGLGRVVLLRQALFQKLQPDAKEWIAAAEFLMKARWDLHKHPSVGSRTASARLQPGRGPRRPSAGSRKTQTVPNRGQSKPRRPPAGPSANRAAAGPVFTPGPITLAPGMPPVAGRRVLPPSWRLPYDPSFILRKDLTPPPLASLSGLFQLLMPRDVQMVPLSLIGAVLAAYVLVIGPVDYFVLGLLRMRRFTWILFPVVTIGFAVFTLWLSRWYLGTNDSRQAIEINDVVKGGTIARRSRIELLFLSRARELGTDVQNGAYAQVGLGVATGPRMLGLSGPGEVGHTDRTFYAGRIPSRYVVGQSVPQWTPIVNRFFWIDPKPAKSEQPPNADPIARFNWDDPGDLTTQAGREALAARIRQAFGEDACAVVFRGDRTIPVVKALQSLRRRRPGRDVFTDQVGIGEIVHELSCRPPQNLFALTSQIAPNGSPELEDLTVLDGSDPGQSLLVIGVESGPDLLIYRRLYAGGP
jgi:hypothetical protein